MIFVLEADEIIATSFMPSKELVPLAIVNLHPDLP